MTDDGPILEARSLRFAYPIGDDVLRNVSMAVESGRRLAILGGNGSGKSTLLLVLNGTLRPSEGEILLGGQPIGYRRRELNRLRRRVGLVLQDPDDQLFSANVYEDVSFGPLNLGLEEQQARRRVDGVLRDLGLTELADRPVHLLSFGQRKLVAIAGVAAMRPEVILLDEPLAGLDPTSEREVMATLERLEASGTTVVLTTHQVDTALAWADTVLLVRDGELLAHGDSYDLLADAELCAQARLRRPGLLDVVDQLRAAGHLTEDDRPTSHDALIALLRGAAS